MPIELQNHQIFQRGKWQIERPDVHQRKFLNRVVGVDEPPAICLPSQLEDRFIQRDPIEVDGNV